MNIFYSILTIIIGYLLGSISMAYLLGRIIRGIDIREHGSKNAGTMNAFKVLGPVYGVVTMLFDLSKGVLAIYVAHLLKVPIPIVLICGFTAIIGHIFPFYMQFKGGRGAATAYGLLIWTGIIILTNYLTLKATIPFAFFFYFLIACYWVTRSANFTAFAGLPALIPLMFWFAGVNAYTIFSAVLCIYLLVVSIITVNIAGGIKPESETYGRKVVKIKLIRKTVRLGAIIIPLMYLIFTRKLAGGFTAVMLGLFIIFEIVRRLRPDLHKVRGLKIILKKGEPTRMLSGYTFYLISALFIILVFPKGIGGLSLLFLTWGDLAAELVGLNYPRVKTFPGKTLEGSLGCFSICLLLGFAVMIFYDISLFQVLIGSLAATFIESIPKLEDNLFMGPVAALCMWLLG
ncbi:glycerol-3-phosphate acyltransferase [candidate division WOR-3 bacterium]|nr:glycerol-3-phosphate acyltransferase [candidate division WOR-3 bacterium]